ncbi:HAMP domain-containing histidine kinase [Bacillus tianshenii]|uniref:sensor histidine kinase n=1 Tax=Sutcliffiella tianshenii TaxID=1463404 RepID=UPI001CD58832|nr:HAMP domain-containing sensor histidine kinase [Bacillus tianshenii]MCA1318485.1 HAMP domain-containing histidine kinase [Bacillus tianshenii]
MKRLRRRLFLHFSFQFISLAVGMIILFILLMLILVGVMTKHESMINYYQTKVESVAIDTGNSINKLTMAEGWDKDLADEDVWVQIIDHNGKVIESSNVPPGFPDTYGKQELYVMQENKEMLGFSLYFYLETTYDEPYLFVLGKEDEAHSLLQQLTGDYNSEDIVDQARFGEIEEKLQALDGHLEIWDGNNQLLQSIGNDTNAAGDLPLDVYIRNVTPDAYATTATYHRDQSTGHLWVLYTPNEHKQELKLTSLEEIIVAFAITVAVFLLLAIILSFWNGFRYGNPLFIFTSWLSRMGNGQYEEVLTEKEKKLIFKKNGKIRMKYRLYAEVFGAFYDMAEKLDQSKKERERLEKTREEWMTGLSHDLRTPLTTMQGYGTLLESGQYDWSKQELKEIGKTIDDKSKYMLSLIEDFSLSFQLKNDSSIANFEPTEINSLMAHIIGKFQEDRTLLDYHLSFEPLDYPVTMPIAKRWFERMVDNLIYNAINHNPPGTNIKVKLDAAGDSLLKIKIEDDGIGMDEETRRNLFNRYYRGTHTEARTEGSGLGMSIALQIAKLHKGSLSVESVVGDGTVVVIELSVGGEPG